VFDTSSDILFLLALLVILLVFSGCFSATETALFSLNRIERRRLRQEKSHGSQLIVQALERPRVLLSTILFGNTLINVATSATAALLFARLIPTHSLSTAIVVDSLLVLLIGEIIPKTIAVSQAKSLAQSAILPLHIFSRFSRPVVKVFDRFASMILRFLKVPEEAGDALSPSELEVLFDEADRKDTITSQERRIAQNIMRFSETTAGEIMTPRVDIVAAPLDRELRELLKPVAIFLKVPGYTGCLDTCRKT